MRNTTGALAVLDHHIGINWDDGPTLMRIGAQVRYRHTPDGAQHLLRVNAGSRRADAPLTFESRADDLHAIWTWAERDDGFSAQLALINEGEDDVLLEGIDVIRIDSAFGGIFNLGAPIGLWQVRDGQDWLPWPGERAELIRSRDIMIQPSASNRTTPPVLRVLALDDAPEVTMRLTAEDARFQRFSAGCDYGSGPLAPQVTLQTPEIWLISGTDPGDVTRE
jgi:hypothetical protein